MASLGKLQPFVSVNRSAVLYNTVGYPLGGTNPPVGSGPAPPGVPGSGPLAGVNYVDLTTLRNYYKIPNPPARPLASPPVIGIVSFGGGIYGQPVSSGQYAGFWKCTDISGPNGVPIQILVSPMNGAINAPNADDGGATLENTVDVATVNTFYGMLSGGCASTAPVFTPPTIILYIAPSDLTSELYRTFYTAINNPVICNGKSYSPSILCCSWGAPEICWTQKVPFPPSGQALNDDPNPEGIVELNEINNLFANAINSGINICVASGDIPLPHTLPLTDTERNALTQTVMFPASSPNVTCVGGSSVFFPNGPLYTNPAEFSWVRSQGGVSSSFPIPEYQANLPSAAYNSANAFLNSANTTADLALNALGLADPNAVNSEGAPPIPNGASKNIALASQAKTAALVNAQDAYDAALLAYNNAYAVSECDVSTVLLKKALSAAAAALVAAKNSTSLMETALVNAQNVVVETEPLQALLSLAGQTFGAAKVSGPSAVALATTAAASAAVTAASTPGNSTVPAWVTAQAAATYANNRLTQATTAVESLTLAIDPSLSVANNAVSQAASAVIAPAVALLQDDINTLVEHAEAATVIPKNYNAVQTPASITVHYTGTATGYPAYAGLNELAIDASAVLVDTTNSSASYLAASAAEVALAAIVTANSSSTSTVGTGATLGAGLSVTTQAARLAITASNLATQASIALQAWNTANAAAAAANAEVGTLYATAPLPSQSRLDAAVAAALKANTDLTAASVALANVDAAALAVANSTNTATGNALLAAAGNNFTSLFTSAAQDVSGTSSATSDGVLTVAVNAMTNADVSGATVLVTQTVSANQDTSILVAQVAVNDITECNARVTDWINAFPIVALTNTASLNAIAAAPYTNQSVSALITLASAAVSDASGVLDALNSVVATSPVLAPVLTAANVALTTLTAAGNATSSSALYISAFNAVVNLKKLAAAAAFNAQASALAIATRANNSSAALKTLATSLPASTADWTSGIGNVLGLATTFAGDASGVLAGVVAASTANGVISAAGTLVADAADAVLAGGAVLTKIQTLLAISGSPVTIAIAAQTLATSTATNTLRLVKEAEAAMLYAVFPPVSKLADVFMPGPVPLARSLTVEPLTDIQDNGPAQYLAVAQAVAYASVVSAQADTYTAIQIAAQNVYNTAQAAFTAGNLANATAVYPATQYSNSVLAVEATIVAANAAIAYQRLVNSYASVTPSLVDAATNALTATLNASNDAFASTLDDTSLDVQSLQRYVFAALNEANKAYANQPTPSRQLFINLWDTASAAVAKTTADLAQATAENPVVANVTSTLAANFAEVITAVFNASYATMGLANSTITTTSLSNIASGTSGNLPTTILPASSTVASYTTNAVTAITAAAAALNPSLSYANIIHEVTTSDAFISANNCVCSPTGSGILAGTNPLNTMLGNLDNNWTTLTPVNTSTATTSSVASRAAVALAVAAANRAAAAAAVSSNATNILSCDGGNSFEDAAALAATEATYAALSNVNMYRCIPDIVMHGDVDDLPIKYRLNGGNVYVGGTSVAAAMFTGFLGVVQAYTPVNFFLNPVLYNNYTYRNPIFNDVSGTYEVVENGIPAWRPQSAVPVRIQNTVYKMLDMSGYNTNAGLGSINGEMLTALLEVPEQVTDVYPRPPMTSSVTVYPGTTQEISAYVEPVSAYNTNVTWTSSSPYNATVQSLGPGVIGQNPLNSNNPCVIFKALVTGVVALQANAPLPTITVSSTDGSNEYGAFLVTVLPAIQVVGVSISARGQTTNPSNTVLPLGNNLQLLATVTPSLATNQTVYWWSSNSAVVNVDASGLITALAPGSSTIKATTVNNNISAMINVYVPIPVTGISLMPTIVTLNPDSSIYPLKNTTTLTAVVTPANADYKDLTWTILTNTQLSPSPEGVNDVISLSEIVLARDGDGNISDNTQALVTAVSNGTAVVKVSTNNGVYGIYSATATVNVVTPVSDISMLEADMVIMLNPQISVAPTSVNSGNPLSVNASYTNAPYPYDTVNNLAHPETYTITATLSNAYPSNMNVFWSSSNPKVAIVSNNTAPVLNTTPTDPNFGLWQITERITPLSNGTVVIKVTTADGNKSAMTTVVVTTPVTGVSLSSIPITLNPGRQYALQATVLPVASSNKALEWESTNTVIATVNNLGVVTAVSSGSCAIIVKTVDGDYTAMTTINVVTPLVGVSLILNTPNPIHIGDQVQILVVMTPTTASDQQFTWNVTNGMNGSIFTNGPPQNGNIVYLDAAMAGSSIFTVTSRDGNKQASISLTVVPY